MKITLIIIDEHNIYMKKADYNEDDRTATVKGRRWFKKGLGQTYNINPKHIKYMWKGKKAQAFCLIDNKTHKSIDLDLKHEVNQKLINRLNYLTQAKFWEARLRRAKIPPQQIIYLLLAGAGLWHFLRLLLLALGFSV
mgnify:CR=1 FL=1